MRPVRSTGALSEVVDRRVQLLRSMLPKGAPTYSGEVDRATAFVAIELLNSWVQFSRSLYLSSCRGARDS